MKVVSPLVLTFVALAMGCHEDVELDPGGSDGAIDAPSMMDGGEVDAASDAAVDEAPIDVGVDEPLALDGGCDDASCADDAGSVSVCHPAGETCATPLDCCSGTCGGSVCQSLGGCAPSGEPCSVGADCCSRACAADSSGRRVCQSLGGCLVAGEVCRSDAACCGGTTGICAAVDGGVVGRCAATSGCAAAGEICAVTGDSASSRSCCPMGAVGATLCHATSIAGISRCISRSAAMHCLPALSSCASGGDCCGGICAPSTTDLQCRISCVATGGACTRAADCCAGECARGLCADVAHSCTALGATCATALECCSTACDATTSSCAPPGP